MNVLIVEDDLTNQFIANRLFEADFEIRNAKNSTEAIELFEKEDFNAVLIDIVLGPESMSGEQLLHELRQFDKGKIVKMIAVSSFSMPEEAGVFIRSGFDMFLSKPYNKEKMVESIKGLIG
jgi:CheY-like chemotaxis protein